MNDKTQPVIAGVVLCGGHSRRMGISKAQLPFGDETMLDRVVRILRQVVSPIVVVTSANPPIPRMPDHVLVTQDRKPDQGPLEGIRMGLQAVSSVADAAYVTGCDVPLLAPGFIQTLIDQLQQTDVAVASENGFLHPLAAVYRTSVIDPIDQLLNQQRNRPLFLYDQVATTAVPTDLLKKADPGLRSLTNLNEPQDYFSALAEAGLPIEDEIRNRLNHPE